MWQLIPWVNRSSTRQRRIQADRASLAAAIQRQEHESALRRIIAQAHRP